MAHTRWLFLCLLALGPSVAAAGGADEPEANAVLAELPVVEAAALHAQTLEEAPANVTIVTAEDIRKYGYRTLGEALAGVRGFYSTYDRIYHYIGVRGFSLPGDYNTRFLVMLNGHPLTDNIYNSNGLFGQDFGLDMDLVSRIEVIRGPTSALYGSNGMLANVNVVTRSPVDMERVRVAAEAGSLGEKKAQVSSAAYLGRGANLLVSASAFNNGGAALRSPGGGRVEGVDGERGYHAFANLVWRDWNITAYLNSREKAVPVPWGDSALAFHRGNAARDGRNFISAAWTRPARAGKLRWELYYDQYVYDDRFDYEGGEGAEDVRNSARGDWVGTQLSYQAALGRLGTFTAGAQINADVRNLQQDRVVAPAPRFMEPVERRDDWQAVFVEQEWEIRPRWTLTGGARLDRSGHFGWTASPRLALVHQCSARTTLKYVYGRPFRNPSVFEQYYHDGGVSFLASEALRPETAQTFEVLAERRLRPGVALTASAYHYKIEDLIEADFLPGDVQQYRNWGRNRAAGFELELSGRRKGGHEAAASYAWQRADRLSEGPPPENSPRHIAKMRAAAPLAGERLWASAAFAYLSPRLTREPGRTRAVALADFTLSTSGLHPWFDFQFGVRNALGWRYADPAGVALASMPGDGRSCFVRLVWRGKE